MVTVMTANLDAERRKKRDLYIERFLFGKDISGDKIVQISDRGKMSLRNPRNFNDVKNDYEVLRAIQGKDRYFRSRFSEVLWNLWSKRNRDAKPYSEFFERNINYIPGDYAEVFAWVHQEIEKSEEKHQKKCRAS